MDAYIDFEGMAAASRARAQAASDASIDLQTAQDTQAAGQAAASRWNNAALAGARRRAGGSTYRNRGTTLSAAPSVLDKANIEQMAAARRKKANADMANVAGNQQPGQITTTLGPMMRIF